jgi:hypothetical protein
MLRSRAAIATGLATAAIGVLAVAASADPPPPGSSAPNCENGQSHAWANDPQGDPFHGGQLFACLIGEPPASEPPGTPPRCESGQAHAWANDPQGDPFHGGQLFACSVGEPPGSGG